MNFTENLNSKALDTSLLLNRDYEFEADLEDHQIGKQDIYRLYYIEFHRFAGQYGGPDENVGVVNCPFKPFMFPEGMSREDGFKVLSYLTDFIEKQQNLNPCSYDSVYALNSVLDLERLGFRRINAHIDDCDVIDLFTVSGRVLLFKKSSHYEKYFEWYTEGVTFAEIQAIYAKCGIDFYDLVMVDDSEQARGLSSKRTRKK